MANPLRKTGLSVLGDMPWGTHFCLFYETKQDLLDILIPYFKVGLESNEFCLWVISIDEPLTEEDAWSALRGAIPNLKQYVAARKIEVLSHEEWFLPGGEFDPHRVIGVLHDKLNQALARNCAGLRLNGSTAWLKGQWEDFFTFETALDDIIADKPVIVLCNFPLATSGAAEILAAARTHRFTLARRNGVSEIIESAEISSRAHSLTAREREVLTWAAQGKSAREIGKILHITKRTVDEHVQAAARKLGATNRTQAVALALLGRVIHAAMPARDRVA
jgi:DNA-binding CsgD family transcriptional regulator